MPSEGVQGFIVEKGKGGFGEGAFGVGMTNKIAAGCVISMVAAPIWDRRGSRSRECGVLEDTLRVLGRLHTGIAKLNLSSHSNPSSD